MFVIPRNKPCQAVSARETPMWAVRECSAAVWVSGVSRGRLCHACDATVPLLQADESKHRFASCGVLTPSSLHC